MWSVSSIPVAVLDLAYKNSRIMTDLSDLNLEKIIVNFWLDQKKDEANTKRKYFKIQLYETSLNLQSLMIAMIVLSWAGENKKLE